MDGSTSDPDREALSLAVRAGFIAQGTTLHRWCHENGVWPQNAAKALRDQWTGEKGRALRNRLIEASGARALA